MIFVHMCRLTVCWSVDVFADLISLVDAILLMQLFPYGEHRKGDSTHPSGAKCQSMESMIKAFTVLFDWPVVDID